MDEQRINAACFARLTQSEMSKTIIPIFEAMLRQMEETGTVGNYMQLNFAAPGDQMREGDLIPQIHFSLQPAMPPIMVEEGEIVQKE